MQLKQRTIIILYGGYHHNQYNRHVLMFSSELQGMKAWNFRMMIRKIWLFLWYQNHNNFEKIPTGSEYAPLIDHIPLVKYTEFSKGN